MLLQFPDLVTKQRFNRTACVINEENGKSILKFIKREVYHLIHVNKGYLKIGNYVGPILFQTNMMYSFFLVYFSINFLNLFFF